MSETTADVETRIRNVLADVFNLDPENIGSHTSTDTIEEWDSLQHLTVVLTLEEEFSISFDDEETVALVTFPLIVEVVREKLEASALG